MDVEKLGIWVEANPEAAREPFMNVTSQRKITIMDVYEELKKEKETGIAIVDDEVLSVAKELEAWLEDM